MKKLLMLLLCSFILAQDPDSLSIQEVVPCEGTCLSEEETKNIFNNIQELEFNLDKALTLNTEYESLMKDYETQLKLKDDMIKTIKPKWYENKWIWFGLGVAFTSGSVHLAGQIN